MPISMKQELLEAIDSMQERVTRGYSSIKLAMHRLTVGQGRQISQDAHQHLELLIARARRRFDIGAAIPGDIVEAAKHVEGQYWNDSDARPALTRAQALLMLRQLREEVAATRPALGELFADAH